MFDGNCQLYHDGVMSSSEWTLSYIVGCVLLIETIHYSRKHNADLQKLMMQLVVGQLPPVTSTVCHQSPSVGL